MFKQPLPILAVAGFARTVNQADTALHDLQGNRVDADALFFEIFQNKVRRASRYVKFSNLAALQCLRQIDRTLFIGKRVGLFLGTGLGNTSDTVKFTSEVLHHYDTVVSPSTFINTVSNAGLFYAARALEMDCTTNVISQETVSFEAALLSAEVLLYANELDFALVGGADVIEPPYEISKERIGSKNVTANSLGEGAAFLLIAREAFDPHRPIGHLVDVLTGVSSENKILEMPSLNQLRAVGLDCSESSASYPYRHLCGDYPTGASFGLCHFLANTQVHKGRSLCHFNQHAEGAFAYFSVVKN